MALVVAILLPRVTIQKNQQFMEICYGILYVEEILLQKYCKIGSSIPILSNVFTPKTRYNFITTNFGSYLAAFCLLMDRQFLLFNKSGEWSLKF